MALQEFWVLEFPAEHLSSDPPNSIKRITVLVLELETGAK